MKLTQKSYENSTVNALLYIEQQLIHSNCLFEFVTNMHKKLTSLMPAQNLLVWAYFPHKDNVEYIYEQDEKDVPEEPGKIGHLASPLKSPTAWVIRHNTELIFEENQGLSAEKWGAGSASKHWVGLPLKNAIGNNVGALVVQSYDENILFTACQIKILRFFSKVLSRAVVKHRDVENIKRIVMHKTELLEQELDRKARSEKLQQAVYDIASLNNTKMRLSEVYKAAHKILNRLIDASNISISEYSEENNEIFFAYVVDSDDLELYEGKTVKISKSLTSYIISRRKACLLNPEIVKAKILTGEITGVVGNANYNSWIGAPMISGEHVFGVIIIQSYEEHIVYTQNDVDLLQYVATQIAAILDLRSKAEQSHQAQIRISKQHQNLEEKNIELQSTLVNLNITQKKIIQQEKMKALNTLVTGVAHEINTPLGVCITGISASQNRTEIVEDLILSKKLSANKLNDFIEKRQQLSQLQQLNIAKANQLVDSFREMSVQHKNQNLISTHLDQLLLLVKQEFYSTVPPPHHTLEVNCPLNFSLLTDSKALQSVFSYLLSNSVIHAFEPNKSGTLTIEIKRERETVGICYKDSGKGMDEQSLEKLFYPFFTTKRNLGAQGLGAYHLYNLITITLQGDVQVTSPKNSGLAYKIEIPLNGFHSDNRN